MELKHNIYSQLPESIQKLVRTIIQQLNPSRVILFGSRARGDHRESSDFDIAVVFPRKYKGALSGLRVDIETEPLTLFKVDLLDFDEVSEDYKKNISQEGKLIYG